MARRVFLLPAVIVMVLLLLCLPAQAAEIRSGDSVNIGSNQVINDDLYVAGGTVTIGGRINGDLIAAGGTIILNGSVRDDVMAAGGTVNLNGPVGQTVRVGGGTVTTNDRIGEDMVVSGGTVDMSTSSTVERDVLVTGGAINLGGNVGRNILGSGGDFIIGGKVGGNAKVTANMLTLAENANIAGDLTYTSENKVKIESGATVEGKTTQKEPAATQKEPSPEQKAAGRVLSFILSYLAAFVFGALLLLMFPRRTRDIADTVLRSPWASLGIGFLLLIVVPIAALILMVFVITIPISLTAIFLYMLGIYLAKVFVGLAVGRWLFGRYRRNTSDFIALLIGLFIVMLLGLIPFIGWLLRFIYVLFGLGAASISIYRMIEAGRAPEAPSPAASSPMAEPSGPSQAGPTQPGPGASQE